MITDEQAKAANEIAKTTGKFAELTEKAGAFVSKIIGPASNQVGLILEDWTRYYRYKNLVAIEARVNALHSKTNVLGKTNLLPPRFAIPMLESASLEDNETLQDVWAKLIANNIDPNFKGAHHPSYVEIIKQMSSDEAIILNSFLNLKNYPILFECHISEGYTNNHYRRIDWREPLVTNSYANILIAYSHHCDRLVLKNTSDSALYLDNLIRLRIVELGYDFRGDSSLDPWVAGRRREFAKKENSDATIPARDEYLRMTSFGENFIAACIG